MKEGLTKINRQPSKFESQKTKKKRLRELLPKANFGRNDRI